MVRVINCVNVAVVTNDGTLKNKWRLAAHFLLLSGLRNELLFYSQEFFTTFGPVRFFISAQWSDYANLFDWLQLGPLSNLRDC